MKSLHTLIHSLSKGEQRVTRTALTCFSGKKDSTTKTLKLFDYLLKNKNHIPPNRECALHIYNNARDRRFKMLKLRFRQKLLDSIVLDLNLSRKGMLEGVDQGNIKVRKKISQLFYLLYLKGVVLDTLLDEVIDLSKKFECYSSLIEALRVKKYSKGFLKGEADFNKINKEIEFYEYCNSALHKANDLYYRHIINANFHARADSDKINNYLEKGIAELSRDYESTNSALVGYYLKLLEMAYFENAENYFFAKRSCLELLDIVKNNKSVYRKARLSLVYMNLCHYNIFLHRYKEAIKEVRMAQSLIVSANAYYLTSKEWEFNALFHENHMEEAGLLITSLIKKTSEVSENDDFRLAKYNFYKAAVLFKQGNYKPVLRELNMHLEISKDKEGWGTAIRVLTIMTLIEMDRLDEVSSRLDSLRKHMERNTEKGNTRAREKIIFRILQTLETSGFILKNAEEKKITGYIKLLNSNDKIYKWKPLSSELIPFHKWFTDKFALKKKK
jgi:hypothetical protein